MSIFRTPEMEKKYQEFRDSHPVGHTNWNDKSILIKEWYHWKLVNNIFYWDNLLTLDHLLIPKRQFKRFFEMSGIERRELEEIEKELKGKYESMVTNFVKARSVTNHFHIHLVKWRIEKSK